MKRSTLKHRDWKALMTSFVTEQDLEEIMSTMTRGAKDGDVQAAALVMNYRIGRPRPAAVELPTGLILGPMSNIAECANAVAVVAQAQLDGTLNEDQAESLRKTIDRAIRIHQGAEESQADDSRPFEIVVQSDERGDAARN